MPSATPIVSVVTASFNCADYILETYESIRAQTFTDWEWIVVDDGSTDNSCLLIERIVSDDRRVRLLRNSQNEGSARSRNRGIDASQGEFIAFVDSDDMWAPDKIEKQLSFFRAGIDFTFTGYRIVDDEGADTGKRIDSSVPGTFSYEDMLAKKATLGCSTVMIRRSAIGELRMPELRTAQDYAFWLKLLRTGMRAHLLPETLASYRIRPGSLSRNKFRKAKQQWKIYREVEKQSLVSSMKFFILYAWRASSR